MAKTVRDSKLENRTSRIKLKAQKEPHWKSVGQGVHIGYYKGVTTASWQVRYRNVLKKYVYETLGLADDVLDSDGVRVLSFFEAQEAARKWVDQQVKIDLGTDKHNKNLTVNDILDNYMQWFKHERKSYKETEKTVNAHIRPSLGNINLSKLSSAKLNEWKNNLASSAGRRRTRTGDEQQYLKHDDKDPEIQRKRKATANRILTVLKAALNRAYEDGYIESDSPWKRIKPFKNVDMPIIRFLEQDECKRLINACDQNFRPLVKAALLTGCRYSELTKLVCADFDARNKKLLIRDSKSNKPRRIALNNEGVQFLSNQILGKVDTDNIFTKKDGSIWGKSHQDKPMYDACHIAKIIPKVGFHILRHTYASQLVMNGISLKVIADQLGHSDTRTCERHYAHLSPSYISDEIEAKMPKLGITSKSNIKKFNLIK